MQLFMKRKFGVCRLDKGKIILFKILLKGHVICFG